MRIQGLGLIASSTALNGFGVQGLGPPSLGFRALVFRVQGLGFRVQFSGFRV